MACEVIQFPVMAKDIHELPNRIREWRLKRGMSQEDLAARTGRKQNQMSRIETGTSAVTLDQLRVIARILDVDVGQLLAREDNRLGLDAEGAALVARIERDPELVPALTRVADAVADYRATPETPEETPTRRIAYPRR